MTLLKDDQTKGGEQALLQQIRDLQGKLEDCPEQPHEKASNPADAASLWWILEDHFHYEPGHCNDYYELVNAVDHDLALLGRVGHDITFAHLCRTRHTVDYAAENSGGHSLTNDEHEELFFFIDKISSALHELKRKYQAMHHAAYQKDRKYTIHK